MTFYKKPKDPNAPKREDAMEHPSCNIGKRTFQTLEDFKVSHRIPVARQIAIALDNELDSQKPFNYPAPDISQIPFVEGEYFSESVKIYQYIADHWKHGIGIDLLLLCRLDFNIPDKTQVMLGLRELIHNEQVVEAISKKPWDPPNYAFIKLTDDAKLREKKNNKYKNITKESGPL